jgi:sugar transferase (PEP-CTERM/EpsH1 system associated)
MQSAIQGWRLCDNQPKLSKRDILYLSHCCPSLPDKGERIRAYHEVKYLARLYRVHVVCFAREARVLDSVAGMRSVCASFSAHAFRPRAQLGLAALRYLMGSSLTVGFYERRNLRETVRLLHEEVRLAATVAFSSAMAPYAPAGVPLMLDMVDVDSEKWFQYSQTRSPKFFYQAEGVRLREVEKTYTRRAKCVVLTTEQEANILRRFTPESQNIRAIENGADYSFFDPLQVPGDPDLAKRRYVVMVGAMDYYPNAEGAAWFAKQVFPLLRERCQNLEFLIVGHQPQGFVESLKSIPGVTVTGYVPDIRPYLAHALCAVAPLHIARGIQNKVLEALVMGKRVVGSVELGKTFGTCPPRGLIVCGAVDEYLRTIMEIVGSGNRECDFEIRQNAARRFSWEQKMASLVESLQAIIERG